MNSSFTDFRENFNSGNFLGLFLLLRLFNQNYAVRIISKFKDYYDGVQSLGIDKELVYERFEKASLFPKPIGLAEYQRDRPDIMELTKINLDGVYYNSNNYIQVRSIEVGFCGRLIPSFQFVQFKNSKDIGCEFFYDATAVLNYIDKLNHSYKKVLFKSGYYYSSERPTAKILNQYFLHPSFQKQYIPWFQDFGTPVFIFDQNPQPLRSRYDHTKNENNGPISIVQNPSLKLMNFYRFKDAYSTYQDIAQFLGGVLTNTEQGDSKLDDLGKIKQHGFDIKYGFRKRPKNK